MTNSIFSKWITNGTKHPFYARKKLHISDKIKSATAYVCGLGQFNFYINGRKVSDHVLDPAWSDYNKIVYYVTFDITSYLTVGDNMIGAEVGNGWYLADGGTGYFFHFPEFMPPNPNPYKPFGNELILAAHIDIELVNGTHLVIEADETWETADHMVLTSNCFGSELVDGAKRIRDWCKCSISEVLSVSDVTTPCRRWHNARLEGDTRHSDKLSSLLAEQKMPPVKVIKTYIGKYLGIRNGKAIYDFGQNVSGMLSFEVKGYAGQEIHAYPAEKLTSDGDVDQVAKKWLPINVCETYIIAESNTWEKFEMTFTYFGGRYIGINTDPENTRNIELRAISSAGTRAGEFWCDDERVMKIYDLIEKAVEANMVSVHTDCPTIERFAWQEENHLMAPSVMYMKSVKKHFEKFLTDTRLSQLTSEDFFNDMHHGKYYPGDGLIPSQAPCYIPNVLPVPGLGDFYNVIGWGSTIILGTAWHYKFYGDLQIVQDNYNAGFRYLEFLKTMVNDEGFINNGLGDWGNPTGEFAKDNVETAFLYHDASTLAYMAGLLGKNEDQKALLAYAASVRDNYNSKLLVFNQETGRYGYKVWDKKDNVVMTQATEAMPLYFGMVPEDKKDDVIYSLRYTLEKAGTLKTGEVAQPYVIQSMSEYGMNDLLWDMILKDEHPSYYAFVLAGETTLGEYWEENPRSHNHDMMGHIAEWFYNGMAGIKPLKPGFKKVLIKPYLPKSVNHIKCSYQSASGNISVEVTRNGDSYDVAVKADEGIEVVYGEY